MMTKLITQEDFKNAVYRAVEQTYYKAIVRATGGVNIVSDDWEIEFQGNDVVIINRNPETSGIIRFLNDGTKPHIITAEGVSVHGNRLVTGAGDRHFLKFKAGGKRKGKYKKIEGNQAFEQEGYIFTKAVRHPGIKARKFINSVMESPKLAKKFDEALDKEFSKFLF